MSKSKLTPPLKWHGGKHYLADKIVDLMPPHIHYVEPYAGGLAVLLAKNPEGVSEVVNDLNYDLSNFWLALQNEITFIKFKRIVEAIPFSEVEWTEAQSKLIFGKDEMVNKAATFFVLCRQSLAGRMKSFAPLSKNRTRRGMNEQVSAWLSAVEGLPEVHERLKRVVIFCRPAIEVIHSENRPNTLFYLDPPYLKETRVSPNVYNNEMTTIDHCYLLDLIVNLKSKVMISGYPSNLYDNALKKWNRHTFDLPNNAAAGQSKDRETEVLWCNF